MEAPLSLSVLLYWVIAHPNYSQGKGLAYWKQCGVAKGLPIIKLDFFQEKTIIHSQCNQIGRKTLVVIISEIVKVVGG